jgi:hypothetical protein
MTTKARQGMSGAPVEETGVAGSTLRVLSLDDIAQAPDTRYEYVDDPEWGGRVRVASLDGRSRQAVFMGVRSDIKKLGQDAADIRLAYWVVAASLVDDAGERLIEVRDPGAVAPAIAMLESRNAAALQRTYDVCRRLSGLGDDEVDDRSEELKATPSASSPTD